MSELQSITDSLARRIQHPVAIDDREMRLLTHSAHSEGVDEARLQSILLRKAPAKMVSWVLSLGIADAPGPLRIPANPAFGMLARVCVPIRCHNTLLGYLWIIDPDALLSEEELAIAVTAAEAAGNVLYRESLLAQLESGRERELVRDLLSDQAEVRRYAEEELVKGGMFVPEAAVSVLVAKPILSEGITCDDELRIAIGQALEEVKRSRPSHRTLQLVRPDHGVCLAAVTDSKRYGAEMTALGRWLHAMLSDRLADMGTTRILVGIGEMQPSLGRAVHSYNQARHATRVAEVVLSLGPVVAWSQLGIYQMLCQFPVDRLTKETLHPGLVRLFEHSGREWLVDTLECYLDNAGDAKATATALNLHRASLYYRLEKIEDVAAVDLRRGEDRLALHLGLKLARLVGIHPLQERARLGRPVRHNVL